MKTLKAFLLGLKEFRSNFTSNCGADAEAFTLRRFDPAY